MPLPETAPRGYHHTVSRIDVAAAVPEGMLPRTIGTLLLWTGFTGFVLCMLALSVDNLGKRFSTALLPVLLVIEVSDLMFATDSIPAIFGVTRPPFIVYTSNIFAILGLRALYFILASAMGKFSYLKVGLGLVFHRG